MPHSASEISPDVDLSLPRSERISIELKRRELTVSAHELFTPHMLRITLTGEDLSDFQSPGFDDNVKLFLTVPGPDGEDVLERRSYTPRRFDVAARELVLDFALHDAGPATAWALEAQVGDTLVVGGPRGSRVVHGDISEWLLIGDETALPAIGRKVEEAPAGTRITVIAGVPGAEDEQQFDSAAEVTCQWLHRPEDQAAEIAPFLQAVRALEIGPRTFIWIAAEAAVAQALKAHVLDERGINPAWIKPSGYWVKGEAGK
ncbi:siderophore-interacting protein [Roseibium aestuarii]|uniref:Siderophore-interacting protein n=1 Tax=Roseibium aestuarii TaxID=2600299 RepID=A0ABW4JWT9_9HYPH|nr:siderophore-interacting protein [Roseibium aestuarii]